MVIERAAARWAVPLREAPSSCQGHGRLEAMGVILAHPLAWMNHNGLVVKALLQDSGLSPQDLIIVHDDLDLSLGRLRIKLRGGAGGHNGVVSVTTALGTDEFCRLKVGIGRPVPAEPTADYVLSPFSGDESALVDAALDRAVQALESLLLESIEAAMNRFHGLGEERQE